MKIKQIVFYFYFIIQFISCASLYERSPESGFKNYDETGEKTLESKLNLNSEDLQMISNRQKLRLLERSIKTSREKELYSKILPLFRSDLEKIEFLSLPSLETKQIWISKKNIWPRSQMLLAEMKSLVESQDIAIGMSQDLVRKSWGEPQSIDVSGNPIYKNEKWKFTRSITLGDGFKLEKRYVYFEGGRVVGWETE